MPSYSLEPTEEPEYRYLQKIDNHRNSCSDNRGLRMPCHYHTDNRNEEKRQAGKLYEAKGQKNHHFKSGSAYGDCPEGEKTVYYVCYPKQNCRNRGKAQVVFMYH